MHDIIVLYNQPASAADFDQHYESVHVPLVKELPSLLEFTWGKPLESDSSFYLVARMSYESAETAAASMASDAGVAALSDFGELAPQGAVVLNVERRS